mmetsp:Transcript_32462/g.85021  ORF Transcript_32462/g.85021 Transcript_32462/m.85021 type:complete len:265 (-) Transcript_32462:24-818(-)
MTPHQVISGLARTVEVDGIHRRHRLEDHRSNSVQYVRRVNDGVAAICREALGGVAVGPSSPMRQTRLDVHKELVLQRVKDLAVQFGPSQRVCSAFGVGEPKAAPRKRRWVLLELLKFMIEPPVGGPEPCFGQRGPGAHDVRAVGYHVLPLRSNVVARCRDPEVRQVVATARHSAVNLLNTKDPEGGIGKPLETRCPVGRCRLNVMVAAAIMVHEVRPNVVALLYARHGARRDRRVYWIVALIDHWEVILGHQADLHPDRPLELL